MRVNTGLMVFGLLGLYLAYAAARDIPVPASVWQRLQSKLSPETAGAAIKDERIIGGAEILDGKNVPYQVAIKNTFGEFVCGGAIISSRWILTAGHCLEWPKQYLQVVTGSVNWTEPGATHTVEDVKVHCLFNSPMYHNDIGLIYLSQPIVFNARTQPIALAEQNTLNDGDDVQLTGWGSTKLWGRTPDVLNRIQLKYLSTSSCSNSVRNKAWLGAGHICSFTKTGEGTCHGDSGSPLVDASQQVLVGLVNWGEACALGYPDVYASVSYYNDWIRSSLEGLNTC